MQEILEGLNTIRGVRGSAIVNSDGIEVMSLFRTPTPIDVISALIASVQQVGEKIVSNAKSGHLKQTIIEATEGKFVIQAVELGFLVVLADIQANLGMIRVEIQQVAPLIK